jgi:hypothetical protein
MPFPFAFMTQCLHGLCLHGKALPVVGSFMHCSYMLYRASLCWWSQFLMPCQSLDSAGCCLDCFCMSAITSLPCRLSLMDISLFSDLSDQYNLLSYYQSQSVLAAASISVFDISGDNAPVSSNSKLISVHGTFLNQTFHNDSLLVILCDLSNT